MSTIAGIIRNRKGHAGSENSWKVVRVAGTGYPNQYALYHYGTCMAEWIDTLEGNEGEALILFLGEGHGSVSDQGGMNTLFRVMGWPYYYSRKGGAAIVEVTR